MAGDERVGILSTDIETLTKRGAGYLVKGDLNSAKQAFELAFRKSQQLRDSFTERACAFNLGAVYIALRQPKDGLEMLQRAVPPMNQRDGKSNGDLFYNFGLGYETLKNDNEAVKYFELALEEYQFERDNFKMEAEVSAKIGNVYVNLHCPLQAARSFGISALAYSRLDQHEQQATDLCKQASCLLRAGKGDDAIQIADNCVVLCQNVEEGELLGRLYNELGLIYSQAHDFPKAATCFELALPLCRGPGGDIRRQAVLLQNLGAIYNSLADFQRALPFHEQAIATFAKLNNRNSQGQCFTNLAFAHSQLGNTEGANECYLHAYQAAKDAGDKKGQWQALEGLGAGAFNGNNIDKAIKYFKQALATLAESGENNANAHERVVAKLTDALQCQIKTDKQPLFGDLPNDSAGQASINILVNDLPRPATAQEILQLRRLQNTKIANEFDTIALGVGGYETDSDRSLSRHRSGLHRQQSKKKTTHGKIERDFERVALGVGEYSTDDDVSLARFPRSQSQRRPKSARPRDYVDRSAHSDGEDERKPEPRKRYSRRQSELDKLTAKESYLQRRGQTRSLLRSTDHDSEQEYNEVHRRKRDGSVSETSDAPRYQERLYPPSTPRSEESEENDVEKKQKKKGKGKRQKEEVLEMLRGRPQNADDTMGDTGTLQEYKDHIERREAGSDSDTETDTNTFTGTDTFRSSPPPPTQSPPPQPALAATYEKPIVPSKTYQNEPADGSSPSTPENPGVNYFRNTGHSMDGGDTIDRSRETNKSMRKETVPDEEDPLYSTIRTIRKTDEEEAGPSHGGAPTLPPPRETPIALDKMTTGEQEVYLYQQQIKANRQMRELEEDGASDVQLPRNRSHKKTSAVCAIM